MTSAKPSARRSRKAAPKPEADTLQPTPGYARDAPGVKAEINAWLRNAELGDPKMVDKMCGAKGYPVRRHADGKVRIEGMPDPASGVTAVSATNASPLYVKRSAYFPSQVDRVMSDASDLDVTPAKFLPILCRESYSEMRQVLAKCLAGHKPMLQPLYTARCGKRESPVEETPEAAAKQVLPQQHDGTMEFCRVDALNKAAATERRRAGNLPYVSVSTTATGEPLVLAWHGQQPTAHEEREFRRVMKRIDTERRQAIEAEVAAFRAARYLEAGLRA